MNRLIAILKLLRSILPYLITALGGAAVGTSVTGCSYDSLVTIRANNCGCRGATPTLAFAVPTFARSATF